MKNYCDTHGLDIPCQKCIEDRFEELEYLSKWSKKSTEEEEKI